MVNGKCAQPAVECLALKCLGVVLAGGKSSRMGTDKAILPFGSVTLLDFQFEKLKSVVGDENVVVSGNYPKFKHVVDEQAHRGPLGGIISVIQKYPDIDYFLFIPVDMPNLKTTSLSSLLLMAGEDKKFDCWSFQNFEMPLVIRNHKSVIAVLEELLCLPKGMRSVRRLYAALKYYAFEVPTNGHDEFLNANTRDDWEKVYL